MIRTMMLAAVLGATGCSHVSPTPAASNDGRLALQPEDASYFEVIAAAVLRRGRALTKLSDAERRPLKAEVDFKVGATGEALELRLARASGIPVFDAEVLEAVRSMAPFPPPPERLRATLLAKGVAIVFSP